MKRKNEEKEEEKTGFSPKMSNMTDNRAMEDGDQSSHQWQHVRGDTQLDAYNKQPRQHVQPKNVACVNR